MFGEVTGEKLLHGETLLGFFQHVWQNACITTVRPAMLHDVFLFFLKVL